MYRRQDTVHTEKRGISDCPRHVNVHIWTGIIGSNAACSNAVDTACPQM